MLGKFGIQHCQEGPYDWWSPASLFLGCYTFSHTCQLALDPEFLCGLKVVGWGAHLVTTLEGPHPGKLELWIGGFIADKNSWEC